MQVSYYLIAAATLLTLFGCGQTEPRATPGAAAQAKATGPPRPAPLRLEAENIFLSAPDGEWQLLVGDDAKALAPGAVAGWRQGKRCTGWVLTGAAPKGVTFESRGRASLAEFSRERNVEVTRNEALLYGPDTGWRWEVWGNTDKERYGHRVTVLVLNGRLYEVHAHATGAHVHTRARRCLDTVMANFDILM